MPDTTKKTIDDIMKEVINEELDEEVLKEQFRANIQKCVRGAIEDSFSYGEMNKLIKEKIEEVMAPEIEKWDISKYVPKLDAVLTELINAPAVLDTKRLLTNFKGIVEGDIPEEVTLERIFVEFTKTVASDFDCGGREVEYDDGPHYKPVECSLTVEKNDHWLSTYEHVNLVFKVDDEEQADTFNRVIELYRRRDGKDSRWKLFRASKEPLEVGSLSCMTQFDVFISSLARHFSAITDDIRDMDDCISLDAEPEPNWE